MPGLLLVLAGDRPEPSPLLVAAGVPAKALVPVAGEPVAVRVLRALDAFAPAAERWLIGPAEGALAETNPLSRYLDENRWLRRSPDSSPAVSLAAALAELGQSIATARPALITTADHALLTPDILAEFCMRAGELNSRDGCDLVVGFTSYDGVMQAFPEGRRTGLKLRDGRYCSCNLFALYSPRAARVIEFWRRVEAERKRPWRIAALVRPTLVLRYLLHRLTLSAALSAIGERAGARIGAALLDNPAAAVDVDSIADWKLVCAVIDGTGRSRSDPANAGASG